VQRQLDLTRTYCLANTVAKDRDHRGTGETVTDGGDTGLEPGGEPTTGTPRWVKVFGSIVLVVVLLLAILLLIQGPGGHGPGRHISFGDSAVQAAPASVTADRTPSGGRELSTRRL
jgi:hypothetical protein